MRDTRRRLRLVPLRSSLLGSTDGTAAGSSGSLSLTIRATVVSLQGSTAGRLATVLVTVVFGAFVIYGSVTTVGFLTVVNLKAILAATATVGIVGVGMTLIMLSGNLFSMSLGITVAVTAIFFLFALQPLGLAGSILATFVLGALICGVQGAMIGGWGANPIIVTIGAGAIQEGISVWLTSGQSVIPPLGRTDYQIIVRPIGGVPFGIYVFAVVALLGELILRRTCFGREIYLLGENRRAARAAALNIPRITTGVFLVAGICTAVAGVLVGAQSGHGELLLGGTLTFDAFAAALVGGNAIVGGRGSILRTVIGALVIATITDMLLLRGYSDGVQFLVKGVVVVVVVVLVHLNTSRPTR